MGNQCNTCEGNAGDEVKISQQMTDNKRFYANAAGAINWMNIEDFIFDIEQTKPLVWKSKQAFEESWMAETVELRHFVSVLKKKSVWAKQLDDGSAFIQLLKYALCAEVIVDGFKI